MMKLKRVSLFWKIFFAFWIANIIVAFFTSYSFLSLHASDLFQERHKARITTVAEEIIELYEQGVHINKWSGRQLDNSKNKVKDNKRHHFRHSPKKQILSIIRDDGKLIFGRAKLDVRKHTKEVLLQNDRSSYRVLFRPIKPPHVLTEWVRKMQSIHFLLILIASSIVAFLLSFLISRPLKQLGDLSVMLADGQLQQRVGKKLLTRRDEIGDLARDFNRMAGILASHIEANQQLLHDVSHELRAPLARLQAASGLVQQKFERFISSSPQTDLIESFLAIAQRIELECIRINGLVQRILDFSRASTQPLSVDDIELGVFIEELVGDVNFQYPRHVFVVTKKPDLINIQGDHTLLRHAFENVLTNACKYSPEDTEVEVNIALTPENSACVLVRDYGKGVRDRNLERLTEPFYRVDASPETQGAGLGLSIVSRVVEKHKGELHIQNCSPGGLRVEIMLPLKR